MLSRELDCTSIVRKMTAFFFFLSVYTPKWCSSDAYFFCLQGTVQLACKRNSFGLKSLLPSGSARCGEYLFCVCALADFLSNQAIYFADTTAAVIYMTFRSMTQARGTRTTSFLKKKQGSRHCVMKRDTWPCTRTCWKRKPGKVRIPGNGCRDFGSSYHQF